MSGENSIAVEIDPVNGTHGAPIVSYHVEIDDGQGGSYSEIKGSLTDDMALIAQRNTGIETGILYRVRYRAKNEVGFGPFSLPAYILSASEPYDPEPIEIEFVDNQVILNWVMPFNAGSLITEA